MSPRSSVAPVVASGTANAVKLLVATLAFAGAYAGVVTSGGATVGARETGGPVQTLRLTAHVLPMPAATGERATAGRVPEPGEITVTTSTTSTTSSSCDKELHVRGLVANPDPADTVLYGWRLQRWSPAGRTWKSYLAARSGFIGESKVVEWRPNVVRNPGWYRVKLSVTGTAGTYSDRFQLSC
ncbi:hypothetical protein [Streptosporangium sp. KLBMP 9127]|nr:hypothetical protein [Streptosporangium sp. KLBMP 9127]